MRTPSYHLGLRLTAALAMATSGCVDTTGGERIEFGAIAVGLAPVTATPAGPRLVYVDEITGYHVELSTATVLVGPVYLWSGRPLLQNQRAASQFDVGFLRGEVTTQTTVDLLTASATAPVMLGQGHGLAGESLSGELWLAPPTSSSNAEATFVVRGIAMPPNPGDPEISFSGTLTIDDTVVNESAGDTAFDKRKVRGLPFYARLAPGGMLQIGCDARAWLAGVDFAKLAEPAEGTERVISFPSTAWNQFFYQVRQSGNHGPWRLNWQ